MWKNMPKFSILTSIYLANNPQDRPDRVERFEAAAQSLKDQNFKDFEWVLVDDGSSLNYDWDKVFDKLPSVNLIRAPQNRERVIALNTALKVSKGEWITFLDSDDQLKPKAIERMNFRIENNPKYKMFNFGTVYAHKDDTFTFRDPFIPKRLKVGHEIFGGGNIPNGTFIFNRSIYEDLGGFPGDEEGWVRQVDCTEINYPPYRGAEKPYVRDLYMGSPYDFSAAAQLEFPEIRKYFMVDHKEEPSGKIIKELGNSWGQDFYLFFKYTRKYHSKSVKEYLYIINPK